MYPLMSFAFDMHSINSKTMAPSNSQPGLKPCHGVFPGVTLGVTLCPCFRNRPEFIGFFV